MNLTGGLYVMKRSNTMFAKQTDKKLAECKKIGFIGTCILLLTINEYGLRSLVT